MKYLKKYKDDKKFLPIHSISWEVIKLRGSQAEKKRPFFNSEFMQTKNHRIEFFYKPILKVQIIDE